jgi:hypothetical protein
VWNEKPDDITWGAFQAYGDPAWKAGHRDGDAARSAEPFVTAHDVLDHLARAEVAMARRAERLSPRERQEQLARLQRELDERCAPELRELAAVRAAIGRTWIAIGEFARGRELLAGALQAHDPSGRVSLRDAEQLANAESRLGDTMDDLGLVETAIARLDALAALAAPGHGAGARPAAANAERSALLGSAWKRKAAVHARRLLAGNPASATQRAEGLALDAALAASIDAYGRAGRDADDVYGLLNRLTLLGVRTAAGRPLADRRRVLADAARALQLARQKAAQSPDDFWALVGPGDAQLALDLLHGRLGAPDPRGSQTLQRLQQQYRQALRAPVVLPRQLDSVTRNILLAGEFVDALGCLRPADPVPPRVAERLYALACSIWPEVAPRRQRAAAVRRRRRAGSSR